MKIEYQQLSSIPDSFLDELKREFTPYSVALARLVGRDTSTFCPLGSGTLVRREGRVGILTARHCLHEFSPAISVGPGGTDSLLLVLRGGRSLLALPGMLYEHVLSEPTSQEYGPDLTFLEILPGDFQQQTLAIASAWPMDRSSDEIADRFGTTGTMIVSVGFPEEFCGTAVTKESIQRLAYHMSSIGSICEGDVIHRDEWDYLDSGVDYRTSTKLPESFGGVSGGGIWGLKIRKAKDGTLSIDSSALVGVSFFQTPLVDHSRKIRGHFVRSLYETAWKQRG